MKIDGIIRLIITAAAVTAGGSQRAHGQERVPALLMQQTPADGGSVSPNIGVHYFETRSRVPLRAIAKPGYQFVYWLGDVGDPASPATVVELDSTKIVVAVFERVEYDLGSASEHSLSGPTGGVFGGAADYARGGFTGSGGRRPYRYSRAAEPGAQADSDEFPVPESDDFPVPVPEPATVVLLAFGSILCRAGVRDKRRTMKKVTQ